VKPPVPSASEDTSEEMLCTVAGLIGQPVGTSNDPPYIGLLLQDNLVTVCAQSQSQPFTGFFPTMALSSTSAFYVESTGQVLVTGSSITPPLARSREKDLHYSVDEQWLHLQWDCDTGRYITPTFRAW